MNCNDAMAQARLAICQTCPMYRAALIHGACVKIRDGGDRVSAEKFADALYLRRQPEFCPVAWKE